MIPTRFFVVSFPIVTLMVGVPSHTWAQSGYIISDDHGGYAGEISSNGHVSDSRGGYAGEVGPSNGTGFSKEQMLAALRLLHNTH